MAISAFNQELLSEYEFYLTADMNTDTKRRNTYINYISDIKGFLEYIEDIKCTEVKSKQAIEWINSLTNGKGDPIKPATRNRKISSLNSFYNTLIEEDHTTKNPFKRVKIEKLPKRILDDTEVLDNEEIDRFKNTLEKQVKSPAYKRGMNPRFIHSNSLRDRALFNLMLDSGMRINEVLGLTMDRIEIIKCEDKEIVKITIPVKLDKNKLGRMTTATMTTVQYINEYRESLPFEPDNDYVFLSQTGKRMTTVDVEEKLKKYLKQAGIDKELTPHKIRHTAATQLINNGNELGKIAKMLGHSIRTLESNYFHQTEDGLDIKM